MSGSRKDRVSRENRRLGLIDKPAHIQASFIVKLPLSHQGKGIFDGF